MFQHCIPNRAYKNFGRVSFSLKLFTKLPLGGGGGIILTILGQYKDLGIIYFIFNSAVFYHICNCSSNSFYHADLLSVKSFAISLTVLDIYGMQKDCYYY